MVNANSINLSKARIESAKEDLITATENFRSGHYRAANNRAYYATFHAIRAVLALDSVDFKTHSRVIGYFNKNYINTDLIDRSLGEVIFRVSKARTGSDYEDYYEAKQEDTENSIEGVKKILAEVERYIEVRLGVPNI
ncbi:MAG: HEPN domain-containing protein [Clostridiales bacterium]|nr:HEPN domain-containing protein [Clostridiales bacterium]